MSPTISRRRSLQALGLALTATLSLAACGGGSDSGSTSGSGPVSITVIRSTGATFEPLFIAQNQGIFTKHGLKVKLVEAAAGGGSTSVPRVLKGEAQFAAADVAGLANAVSQGLPVKATVTTQLSTSTDPVSDGLLVAKDSSIKSYADLAGKKVGLSAIGGFPQAFVTIGAKKAGISAEKIQFVQLPTASLTDALKKGTVDAIISFASFYDAAKSAGMVPIGNGSNDLPGVPQSLFFASTQWLAKNQATAKKFSEAMADAFTYANAHADQVRAIDKQYTQLTAAYIDSRTIQKFGGTPDKDQIKAVADALVDLKVIKKAPSYDDLYWNAS